ncbi:MAG: TIGR03862 family flavoprotein [Pseudomonadota bacterium]
MAATTVPSPTVSALPAVDRVVALVIGTGPAGLMAAETLSAAGRQVLLVDAMPSPGRKFLMAGKSGLNLTMDEPLARFLAAYGAAAGRLAPALGRFGPEAARAWAEGLGQPLFTGSSGRVFPVAMKASPLLRAWLARLAAQGVTLRRRWRWTGEIAAAPGAPGVWTFDTPTGPQTVTPSTVVLALGGASWRRLGSDGAWAGPLGRRGVALAPFRPANMALSAAWSAKMAPHFGAPLKPVRLSAGGQTHLGECVLGARGLEGSGIYALYRPLRDGAALTLDLAPDLAAEALAQRLARGRRGATLSDRMRRAGLSAVKRALAQECERPLPAAPAALARLLKALAVPHTGPRPMDEAISTGGGVAWDAVDTTLQLRALPGVRVAGEMLDWEAPTGGYLITGCLATGAWAGRAAAAETEPETETGAQTPSGVGP